MLLTDDSLFMQMQRQTRAAFNTLKKKKRSPTSIKMSNVRYNLKQKVSLMSTEEEKKGEMQSGR